MNKELKRVRVLLAKPGLDGHSRGIKSVAYALRDAGVEVIYSGLRQTTDQIIKTSIQESVDIIGLSILSGGHLTICEKLMKQLKEKGLNIIVIVGGVIPIRDESKLTEFGVVRVFSTNSKFEDIINFVKNVGEKKNELC